jgi:proline iminopeptidase
MKTLKILIAVLISASIIGCKNQSKNSSDKQNIIPKSGELVFGDKKVTYGLEGEGIPCFVCADGEIQKIFLSDELKEHFKFVFIEQRHSTYYDETRDYSKITMDTIVDDIEMLRTKLGFDKVYVLGHSIIGLIALEYARKYPNNTKGVIMINTPPHFNMNYMKIINKYWDENASEARKKILWNNLKNLEMLNKDSISKDEWNYLSNKAYAPKNYYDSLYVNTPYFRVNEKGWNHFYTLMREYDIERTRIETPVFLSLSKFDFMVPEILWSDYINKLPTLNKYNFDKSGHYPHVEEQELFDKKLLKWIKDN